MKQLLGIFMAILVMPASTSFAHIGGPFSNNSYFPDGDDGVYEAVATMSNGLGLYRFGVQNTAANGTGNNVLFGAGIAESSTHTWYYKGIFYYGNCFGIANSNLGIVSATGNAQTRIGGDIEDVSFDLDFGQDIPQNGADGDNDFGSTTVTFEQPTNTTLEAINGISTSGPVGGNVQYANSSWLAKINQEYPVMRFSGTGQVSFVGNIDIELEGAQLTVDFTDFAADDSESSSDSGSTDFDSGSTYAGTASNVSQVGSTGGESQAFSQRGHVRQFLIFGTRVSTQIFN